MELLVLRHLPALFIVTALALGGAYTSVSSQSAIAAYGPPERLARLPEAQTAMLLSSANKAAFSIAMLAFHLGGQYVAIDLLLLILGTVEGSAETYVAWRESLLGQVAKRATIGALIAAWGWLGMRARR